MKNSLTSTGIYVLEVNNEKTNRMCEIFSKLSIKTPERVIHIVSGIFSVDVEQISHIALVSHIVSLLTLNK